MKKTTKKNHVKAFIERYQSDEKGTEYILITRGKNNVSDYAINGYGAQDVLVSIARLVNIVAELNNDIPVSLIVFDVLKLAETMQNGKARKNEKPD